VFQQWKMTVRGRERFGRDPTMIGEFTPGAQIHDGADSERRDSGEVHPFDSVDAIGPVDQPPPDGGTLAGGVTAEVTKVERPLERDPARSNMRFDLHTLTVTIGCDTEFAAA
jgi:hypothetical protein